MACRICMESANLTSVCGCQGTMELVHEECIRKWHAVSGATTCELCKEPFRLDLRRTDMCAIALWLGVGSSLAVMHAFMLWRQISMDPNDVYGTIVVSVVVNIGYVLVLTVMKHNDYHARYHALLLWLCIFVGSSIALHLSDEGISNYLLVPYGCTILSFFAFYVCSQRIHEYHV